MGPLVCGAFGECRLLESGQDYSTGGSEELSGSCAASHVLAARKAWLSAWPKCGVAKKIFFFPILFRALVRAS